MSTAGPAHLFTDFGLVQQEHILDLPWSSDRAAEAEARCLSWRPNEKEDKVIRLDEIT